MPHPVGAKDAEVVPGERIFRVSFFSLRTNGTKMMKSRVQSSTRANINLYQLKKTQNSWTALWDTADHWWCNKDVARTSAATCLRVATISHMQRSGELALFRPTRCHRMVTEWSQNVHRITVVTCHLNLVICDLLCLDNSGARCARCHRKFVFSGFLFRTSGSAWILPIKRDVWSTDSLLPDTSPCIRLSHA